MVPQTRGHLAVPIEVAVLDLAGTTVNDHGMVRSGVASVAGNRFDEIIFDRLRGASKPEMLAAFVGADEVETAHARLTKYFLDAIATGEFEPLPGARSCLEQLRDAEIRTCLVTGFSRPVRTALLEHLGWDDLVDLTLSPEDVGRGRPAPDLVLAAALSLEASDIRAVAAVGDTVNDVVSAFRAGCHVRVAVLTGAHDAAKLQTAPVTHLLADIGEFPAVVVGPHE